MWSSPNPKARARSTSARARSSCTGVRASAILPPWAKCAVDPSSDRDAADLGDGVVQRALLGQRPLAPGHRR